MESKELIELLDKDAIQTNDTLKSNKNKSKVLIVKSANEWTNEASNRPLPEQLFSSLWFEGEICILFADTNCGKSILAVQIIDAITKGIGVFDFKVNNPPKKVLYLDFELSDKQFQIRYSSDGINYQFHDYFLRTEFDIQSVDDERMNLEELVLKDIENLIIKHEVRIIVIDNITYLKPEMEKSKNALPLMKKLKSLKIKHQLSLLILAHTPKRDISRPITNNDVAGSKMLINFCDSAFSIGRSSEGSSIRYIKQIKVRNAEEKYGTGNVIVCEIIKVDSFLKFDFVNFDEETNHLKINGETGNDELNFQISIKEILIKTPNASNREIARQLNTNHQKIGRHIKKMKESGTLV